MNQKDQNKNTKKYLKFLRVRRLSLDAGAIRKPFGCRSDAVRMCVQLDAFLRLLEASSADSSELLHVIHMCDSHDSHDVSYTPMLGILTELSYSCMHWHISVTQALIQLVVVASSVAGSGEW